MENTCIWEANKALCTMHENVKDRVVFACNKLTQLSTIELDGLSNNCGERIKALLSNAGKDGPLKNNATGEVIYDKFKNTARNKFLKTYRKYAEEIFSINEIVNNNR
jgi:hypothetical protein